MPNTYGRPVLRELAGDRVVEVAAGDVGGQVLAAGLIDLRASLKLDR